VVLAEFYRFSISFLVVLQILLEYLIISINNLKLVELVLELEPISTSINLYPKAAAKLGFGNEM